jgi:peptide/nickel transport system ATP-binding protein
MKQRMVMVLSTLLNPALLIADEITSALDVASQKAVAEMLVGFRNQKYCSSAIVITHDISILAQIADSILVMYAGRLAEKAATHTIIHSPRHPYTWLLISSSPEVGVRYVEKRLTGIPGSPPRCSILLSVAGSGTASRRLEKCVEVPPFVELYPGPLVARWREI